MDFIKHTKLWFLISAILIIPGVIALFTWGLNLGIDFKGGTVIKVEFDKNIEKDKLEESLKNLNLKDLNIQPANKNQYIVRTVTTEQHLDQDIEKNLNKDLGNAKILSYESVGPSVSSDLTSKAFQAVIIASIAIIIYLAISFRNVPKPTSSWRFGLCAVVAVIHDALFIVGAFAILGHYFGYEVNSLFITAVLTIIGFSVHDTIVVFDRIRENLRLSPTTSLYDNANNSIMQTVARSINTSLTVMIVLSAMFLLGGDSIKQFILTLLLGMIIGTYSSIFNAAQLFVIWQNYITKRAQTAKAS